MEFHLKTTDSAYERQRWGLSFEEGKYIGTLYEIQELRILQMYVYLYRRYDPIFGKLPQMPLVIF